MELLSLSNNKWKEIPVNLIVVLLFVFVNPIYALFFCAFLNLTSSRINYWIFSFIFALSFGLMFYLKDYSNVGLERGWDLYWHISSFQTIDDLSWSGIIYRFINLPHGNEPFFWLYVKLVRTLITNNASSYVFFQYFTIFVLIAYLGKIVNANKFVIIILCILLANFGILANVWEVWRHTMAFLIFMIGVFSFDASGKNRLPRFFIYSSMLFHISTVLIIIFFEIFVFITKRSHKYEISKLYFKDLIGYVVFVVLVFSLITQYGLLISQFIGVYKQLAGYFQLFRSVGIGYNYLFNSFSFFVCMFLWLSQKKLTKADVFIATQYFIIIVLLIEISVPDIFSRYMYFATLGGAIIIGKMVTFNYRLGFILLSILFMYDIYTINYSTESIQMLSNRLYGEYNNPAYGLFVMIHNYDTILNFNF